MVWRRTLIGALVVLAVPAAPMVRAVEGPAWLPRYEIAMNLDLAKHSVHLRMRATWTNMYTVAAKELVLNAHSRYVVPDKDIGLVAKTLEIFRMDPGEGMGEKEPALDIHTATLADGSGPGKDLPLAFHYEGDSKTTLVLPLPYEVQPGQSATVVLDMTFRVPQKQGRWGEWKGVTTLVNWLPVFSVYGPQPEVRNAEFVTPTSAKSPNSEPRAQYSNLWQPTPFIPWHLPFFNEAGNYRVCAWVPKDQIVGCTGMITARRELGDGRQELDIRADCVRDFAFLCSARYQEFRGEATIEPGKTVPVRVLAFPENEFYAREILRIACEAITAFSDWFGPYPFPEFTITESFFGWNGNQCGALVMIDERVFSMPHVAVNFVDSLVSHETCHQWWYNLVGVNGYSETWMDEGLATHFSHRLIDKKVGKNNNLLSYPPALDWLPNIRRDDYRSYSFYGTLGRGENGPVVQEMPGYSHVINLFSMCYDKGSRIVGMIENRMGEVPFHSFMRRIQQRYRCRILRVADFRRELEEYTGQSWEAFFRDWLYGKGMCDWSVENVNVGSESSVSSSSLAVLRRIYPQLQTPNTQRQSTHVVVNLRQKAEYNEETVLGFQMVGEEGYSIRIPITPQAVSYRIEEPPTTVTCLGEGRVRVEIDLPGEPKQIAIDPDQILLDKDPANNYWKPPVRWRFTPVNTFLEETDLTNAYDRWNVIYGPWVYGEAYADPWYQRTMMMGFRAEAYRTQQFDGGVYTAFRPDYKDVIVGADGLWDHWPDSHYQVGFNVEKRLWTQTSGDESAFRAVVFGRYIFGYGDSLYLPPMHYLETFVSYQDNFFPEVKTQVPGGERFDLTTTAGIHYRIDYLTPYWNPEGGFRFDAVYQNGFADLAAQQAIQTLTAQVSFVKSAPDLTPLAKDLPWLQPGLQWLADSRLAFRAYGACGLPSRGEFFTLGGGEMFRGYDLSQRQGSSMWIASGEWRMPLMTGLHVDACDHVVGLRSIWGAAFCDVGDAYVDNRSYGPVAVAVGGGLRFDVAWLSFVERTLLRIDVAKTVNDTTPLQLWFDVQVPF